MLELRAAVLGALVQWSDGLYDPVQHIESARLYGNIDYFAYYFVDLLIGTPPQRVSVILDTGSGVAAFPCASCDHCGKHIDPNFDIAKSSTAKWVPCGGKCRGTCKKDHCSYHQGYQEGSAISGYWFQDWVRLGDAIQRNPPVKTNIGCHYNENNLFYTQKANGIMGIRGSGNLLEALFGDKPHVDNRVFSICLAEWGGRLVVGGHNSSYHRGNITWTKVSPASYGVNLKTMQVGGRKRSVEGFGSTMIDSGTTYTYMNSRPYKALKSEIENYCREHKGCGAAKNGLNCYTVTRGLKSFPNVEVTLKGATTIWEPRGYLYRKGKTQMYCYSFEDDGPNAGTVLGASFMLYHEIIFDLRVNLVGIVQAECPEYRKRPKHKIENLDPPTAPPTAPPTTVVPTPSPTTASTSTPAPTPATTSAPTPNPTSKALATAAPILPAATPTAAASTAAPTAASTAAPTPAPNPPSKTVSSNTPTLPVDPERTSEPTTWFGYTWALAFFLVFLALCVFGGCARRMCANAKEHGFTAEAGSPQIVGSVSGEAEGPGAFVIGDGDDDDNSEEQLALVHNVEPVHRVGNAGVDPLGSPKPPAEPRSPVHIRRAPPSGDGPLE